MVRFTQITTLLRDKMCLDETQHLRCMQTRNHRQADRLGKRALLDEMGDRTARRRKSTARRADSSLERQPHRRERGADYGPESGAALALISEATDYVARRAYPHLLLIAKQLEAPRELTLTPTLREQPPPGPDYCVCHSSPSIREMAVLGEMILW